MLTTCALMSVTLLGAASIKPAQVPATHKQVADVRIEQAGMYHISARSDSGTACTLVDHQRGPFANSGTVAKKNCELDLLLDSGTYRLRLESAKEGSGTVQLSVKAFADRFERPLKLERGRSDNTQLPQGQQASEPEQATNDAKQKMPLPTSTTRMVMPRLLLILTIATLLQ